MSVPTFFQRRPAFWAGVLRITLDVRLHRPKAA